MAFKRMKILSKPSTGKVRNSTKVEYDNIKFDSKLECYCYKELVRLKIDFELKPKYNIVEGFTYKGEKVRPITLTPDFLLTQYKVVIDTKGYQTEDNKIKMKLFKRFLLKAQKNYDVVLLSSQKAVNKFLQDLIS